MSPRTRFVVLGGFLGAGKTTTLIALARRLADEGRRVGVVANDQAGDLVDTATFRAAGLATDEVGGGCFCCRFDDLLAAADRLGREAAPDVLLAEPVGSCTDVVSTVIQPLERAYGTRFDVAPYVVLLDGDHAWDALTASGPAGFSAKVTYIFRTQQHEADVVAINKIDGLAPARRAELERVVRRNFPRAEVMQISARTGEGLAALQAVLCGETPERHPVGVDYDTYAAGEALLAWMNSRSAFSGRPDGRRLLSDLLGSLARELAAPGPVRAKAALHLPDATWTANLLPDGECDAESRPAAPFEGDAVLLLNARAEMPPPRLEAATRRTLARTLADHGLDDAVTTLRCFSPPRPEPTHAPGSVRREA